MSTGRARESSSRSPGQVFVRGLVAGLIVVLAGDLILWLLDRAGFQWVPVLLWLLPALAGTAAAVYVARALAASGPRTLALGVVALLTGFLIIGVMEYVALFSMIVPADDLEPTPSWEGAVWRLRLSLWALCIGSGALLGMMFGRGSSRLVDKV
jgi:hypothetical protein